MRICVIVVLLVMVLCSPASAQLQRFETGVGIRKLALIENDTVALALSAQGDKLLRVDLASGATTPLLEAGERGLDERYIDFSVDRYRGEGSFVFVGGVRGKDFGEGIILRVHVATGEVRSLLLIDEFIAPSISTGPDFVFFGDITSSVVTVVDRSDFEGDKAETAISRKSSYLRNLFIRGGTTRTLTLDPGGSVLFVAHFDQNRISAFDALRGEQMLAFSPGRERSNAPLLIADAVAGAGGADMAIPLVTPEGVGLINIRFDNGRVDQETGVVPHGWEMPRGDQEGFHNRAAIAASASGNLVAVADRETGELLVLSVTRNGSRHSMTKIGTGLPSPTKGLSPLGRVKLPAVDALVLSRDGQMMVAAGRESNTLTVIRDLRRWLHESGENSEVKLAVIESGPVAVAPPTSARSAVQKESLDYSRLLRSFGYAAPRGTASLPVWADQQALAILSYPVGVADGIVGPRTRDAVRLFASAAGLPVQDYPSPEISQMIRRSVVQKVSERAVLDALLQNRRDKGSTDLKKALQQVTGHCERLSSDDLCISQRFQGGGGGLGRGSSLLVEERFCEGSKSRQVQIDTYVFLGSKADYFCSRDVSCATIQFDVPSGYRTVCSPK